MFKNYFKIAIRQLLKQKMYSAIKIGGFALSIAACILIALYIADELSYDKFYPDTARIYRLVENRETDKGTAFPAPLYKVLKTDYPEIENSGRLMPDPLFPLAGSNEVKTLDRFENTHEEGFSYADQEMLDILKIPMVYGDRSTALSRPHSIVISKRKADKYFPNQDPLGKSLYLNNEKTAPFIVGGVMENFPHNSHLQYDFLITMKGVEFGEGEQTNWNQRNYYDYVLVKPGTDIASLNKKLTAGLMKNYFLPSLLKIGYRDAEKILQNITLELQPVSDIHLRSANIWDEYSHGDIRFIWLFSAIAAFILTIACINFINLSTAKSANRAKEIGLRKVVGSTRYGLITQFLTESLLFSFLSFVVGIILAWLLLPYFNNLASKTLSIPWATAWFIPTLLLSAFIVGVFAGLYPAFYLSSFKPTKVLKGQMSRGSKNAALRNALVVFQFASSIVLIISTIVIYSQMKFILNKKVGYDKDQVLLLQGTNTLGDRIRNLKTELLQIPTIRSVSIGDYLPIAGTKRNENVFYQEGKTTEHQGINAQAWAIDEDYLKTMGIKLVAGRNFSPLTMKTDSQAVIINQTMAAKLNLNDPIGKRITNRFTVNTVIGVVQDFNFESLRDQTGGVVMQLGNSPSITSVKLKTADINNTLAAITEHWKKISPDQPIRYTFMDEQFAGMYADVQRMGRIFTSFAVLAIIIACLGLFALSAFMSEQRSREIGIRKVLGASVGSITSLLSVEFIKLVAIAIVIGSPLAWWAMSKWLQDFTYRTNIGVWVFLLSGGIAIMIALFTVSFQSIKAALTSPVKSLKAE